MIRKKSIALPALIAFLFTDITCSETTLSNRTFLKPIFHYHPCKRTHYSSTKCKATFSGYVFRYQRSREEFRIIQKVKSRKQAEDTITTYYLSFKKGLEKREKKERYRCFRTLILPCNLIENRLYKNLRFALRLSSEQAPQDCFKDMFEYYFFSKYIEKENIIKIEGGIQIKKFPITPLPYVPLLPTFSSIEKIEKERERQKGKEPRKMVLSIFLPSFLHPLTLSLN